MPGKRFGRRLAASVFTLCVVGLVFVMATNIVFGTPDHLKRSLAESEAYTAIAENVVFEQAQQNAYVSLTNPDIKAAINKSLTPEEVRRATEQVIDGTYNWLEGETATPTFNVSLDPLKQNIASAVSDAGVQRVQEMPVCTPEQLQQFTPETTDPFAFPCRPPNFDLTAIQQQYSQQIAARPDFFSSPNLSPEDIRTEGGQDPFQRLDIIPKVFRLNKILPWILGLGALLSGAAVLFWHDTKRQGLKTLARTLLVAGGLLLLGTFIVSYLFDRVQPPEVNLGNGLDLRHSLLTIVRTLSSAYTRILFIAAIIYAVLGVIGLVAVYRMRPKTSPKLPNKPSTVS